MPEPTPSAAAVATAKTLCVCQLCARTTTEWPVHVVPCRRLAIARALDSERAKVWEEAARQQVAAYCNTVDDPHSMHLHYDGCPYKPFADLPRWDTPDDAPAWRTLPRSMRSP